MKLYIFLFGLLLFLFTFSCSTGKNTTATKQLPEPIGFVNDFEKILTQNQEDRLLQILTDYEKHTSNEIVVVRVKSIKPYETLFDFSLDLAKTWGVGKAEKNNGILIAISKELKAIRIQNGIGIEQYLSDEKTKVIMDEFFIPEFKKGNYYEGLKTGINEIIKELDKMQR